MVKLAVGPSWTAQPAPLLPDPEGASSPAPRTAIRPRACALPVGARGRDPATPCGLRAAMAVDATGSEPQFLLFFFFFQQTQERATCLHFCVQPQRRVSLALGTNAGLEPDWPDRVLAARRPWELALSQAATFDCLKMRPSWPGGQLGHLVRGWPCVCRMGHRGAETGFGGARAPVGEGRARPHHPGGVCRVILR